MRPVTPYKTIAAIVLLIGGAFAVATVTAPAKARQAAICVDPSTKLALNGYDPVAYFVEGKPVKGSASLTSPYQGATFAFATESNRAAFAENPAKYAPQFGGYCALGVTQGYTASGDPLAWKIVDDKLYLNYSKDVAATWSKDIPSNITKGNANWPKVLEK